MPSEKSIYAMVKSMHNHSDQWLGSDWCHLNFTIYRTNETILIGQMDV